MKNPSIWLINGHFGIILHFIMYACAKKKKKSLMCSAPLILPKKCLKMCLFNIDFNSSEKYCLELQIVTTF